MRNYFHCRFAILLWTFLHLSFALSAQFGGGGDGSANTPYQISNRTELEALANLGTSGKDNHFRLTADIDLGGAEWTPIKTFYGKFHGGGHRIKNILINASSGDWAGLFSDLGNGAYVDSVHIVGGEINVTQNISDVGALAGNIGGDVTIFGCSNSAQVNVSNGANTNAGGLIGTINYSGSGFSLTSCVNTGTITGSGKHVGGLIGSLIEAKGIISDSYSQALIQTQTTGASVGGLVGYITQSDVRIEKCYAAGQVHAASNSTAGGLAGFVDANNVAVIIKQSVAAQDTLTGPAGKTHRIVGENNGGILSDNFAYDAMFVNGSSAPNGGSTSNEGQEGTLTSLQAESIYNALSWNIGNTGNTWNIRAEKSFPYLQWQSAPVVVERLYYDKVTLDMQGAADVLVYRITTAGTTFLEKITAVSSGEYPLSSSSTINPGDNLSFITYEAGKQPSSPVVREVSKRNITITATSQTITYGEDSDLHFGEGSGYSLTVGTLSDGHALAGNLTLNNVAKSSGGYYKAGTYTFNFDEIKVMESETDVTDDYYDITFSNATVTINKLQLTHNIVATNKVYDRTTAASYTGDLLPDNIKINDVVNIDPGFRLVFKNPDVGDYKEVIPLIENLWTLAGADGGNYKFLPWDTEQPWAKANIAVKPLDDDIIAVAASQTYTSSACTTTVVVAFSGATLTKDVDYTIDENGYIDNVNAGAATATIRGKGNYDPTSTKPIPFTIHPMTIEVEELTAEDKTYDGTTAATLTFDKDAFKAKLFESDRDGIEVDFPKTGTFDQANVDKNITVTPSDDVTLIGGNKANYVLIQPTELEADINPKSIASNDVKVAAVPPQTYTGSSITPSLTIHDGTTLLYETPDYTISYRGNVDVGAATVTIRGAGNYSNTETISTTFTIVQKPITITELKAKDKTYDGTTDATITFDEKAFRNNKLAASDVDKVYIMVTAPTSGTFTQPDVGSSITVYAADVKLDGPKAKNYTVEQQTELTANITQRNLFDSDLTIEHVDAQHYSGVKIEPPLTVTESTNLTLNPANDYTVTYDDNVDAGTASATVTITTTGNYSGGASAATTFTILKKTVKVEELTAEDKTYDGTAAATLTFAKTAFENKLIAVDLPFLTITPPTSGTFTQSDKGTNIPVTAATVTLGGDKAKNYTVEQQTGLKADILQKAITASDLTIAPVSSYTYTGMDIRPSVTVTESANTLTLTQDYTVGYTNNKNAGSATITVEITGTGNYSGNASTFTTFLIMPKDINKVGIASVLDQTYTGTAITPSLTVTDGATALMLDTDYTVAYEDNTAIGTASATVTGINNYTNTRQLSFNIIQKSITDVDITIEPIPAQTYTGATLTPPVTVFDGAITLNESTDYTTSYADNIHAGTATVTVTGTGNYSGSSAVTFEILKADQTITFPDIPALWMLHGSHTLQATATSGFPVTYTSSNPDIVAIGGDGVTLQIKKLGAATITASQQGDSNYNPAPDVQRRVVVEESGKVGVVGITVIGATLDAVNERYLVNCSDNSVTVIVELEDYTAQVSYNNIPGNPFTVEIPIGVHTIYYKVSSGTNTQEYPIEIAKPFKFDDVVQMRWNNTLAVINNPANNGGFHFTSFAWYGNGRLITTKQSFSAGNTGQTIDPGILYHVALTAEEYVGALTTCPSAVTLRPNAVEMVAYPNPAQSNGFVFVEINMDEAQLDHAEIEIINIIGASMGKVRVVGRITPINTSALPTGIYLLNLRGKNDLNKIVKVLVQ